MPVPDPDFILAPPRVTTQVALEPAHNALNSLIVLSKASQLSGLDAWVERAALTPTQQHTNRLVIEGLHYALPTNRHWSSFPTCVDYLAAQNPGELSTQIFEAYLGKARQKTHSGPRSGPLPAPTELLTSLDTYLAFLQDTFPPSCLDLEIETEAYTLLKDPPAMQNLMVSHLRSMWETVLAPEWERVRPMLQASVEAFQQIDLTRLSPLEAAQVVVGRALENDWETACLRETDRIIFVPSAHIGPYLGKIKNEIAGERVLWLFFAARQPEGVATRSPDLSRAELLIRLNALGDETRLRILALLTEYDELCAQDIQAHLNLSQSAASRHLKQLSATGYLIERAKATAKCYRLNPERIEDTLGALAQFLLKKGAYHV